MHLQSTTSLTLWILSTLIPLTVAPAPGTVNSNQGKDKNGMPYVATFMDEVNAKIPESKRNCIFFTGGKQRRVAREFAATSSPGLGGKGFIYTDVWDDEYASRNGWDEKDKPDLYFLWAYRISSGGYPDWSFVSYVVGVVGWATD